MILVYESTGVPVKVGDIAETFRGEKVEVSGIDEPRHACSTGRVYVRDESADSEFGGFSNSYFPSVIGAVWRDEE